MAGPEPYPQEKWTRAQDEAYAESHKAGKGGGGTRSSQTGGKRKRFVRTEAGAKRYHVPIGAEIGTARNSSGAQAQKDTESTGRYQELVGGDRNAQSVAMRGLNDDQLQRLSRVAYSFKSSNPDVVRLRIGVANELARRGMNVNDFGGLGRGSAPRPRASAPRGKKVVRNSTPAKGTKPVKSAMYARRKDRRLTELSVPKLRVALSRFARIAPDKREVVARFLVNRAVELSAASLLGQSVIEAANLPDSRRTEVIELAGKWRHGYIPLDAAALASKMKGNTGGKHWWGAPKAGSGGGKLRAKRNAASGGARVGGTSSNSPFKAMPRSGNASVDAKRQNLAGANLKARKTSASTLARPDVKAEVKAADAKVSARKMNASAKRKTNATENEKNNAKYFASATDRGLREQEMISRRSKTETPAGKKRLAAIRAEMGRRNLKPMGDGEMTAAQERTIAAKRTSAVKSGSATAKPRGARVGTPTPWNAANTNAESAKAEGAAARANWAPKTQVQPNTASGMGGQNASEKYVEMHGVHKAQARLDKLRAKKNKTPRDEAAIKQLTTAWSNAVSRQANRTHYRGKSVSPTDTGTKSVASPPGATLSDHTPDNAPSNELEKRSAVKAWERLDRLASNHSGRITSQSATEARIEFPISTRAAGFYDELFSRWADVRFGSDQTVVLVRKPR